MDIIKDIKTLRQISSRVEQGDPVESWKALLIKELRDHSGLGLSLIQVGITKRMCIVKPGPHVADNELIVFVNPEIIAKDERIVHPNEGCLSLPELRISTKRYNKITVKDDVYGELCLEGLSAVIAMHEIQHLDGMLITDVEFKKNLIGRNDPCCCGSGKKYKKCCGK